MSEVEQQVEPVEQTQGEQSIARRAVVLSLAFRRLGSSRRVPTAQIEEGIKGAELEMVSATKKLFRSCPEMKAVASHLSTTKLAVSRRSLPSLMRGGLFLLPTGQVEVVDAYLAERAAELAPLVEAFVSVLDQRIEESKAALGGLANDADWPTAEQVRKAFRIEWRFMAFDTPGSLKGISKALWERERVKAAGQVAEIKSAAQALLRQEMADLVAHMVDRLTPGEGGKKRIFRDSTVGNLSEFLAVFDDRNLGDDVDLAALVQKARKLTEGIDPKDIRNEEGLRNAIATGFESIKADLDRLVIEAPVRKINLDDEE